MLFKKRLLFILVLVQILFFSFFAWYAYAGVKVPWPYSEVEPGGWIDNDHQLLTYETICKGYVIVDYSNKNKIKYTGFGDLADKYTYEENLDILTGTASSTP